ASHDAEYPVLLRSPTWVLCGKLGAQRVGDQRKNDEPARVQVNRNAEDSSKPHARRRRTRRRCRSLVGSNVRWILVVRRHCVLRNPPARFIIVVFAAAVSQIAFAADAARSVSIFEDDVQRAWHTLMNSGPCEFFL